MSKKKSKKTAKLQRTTAQDIEELLSTEPPKISMVTGSAVKSNNNSSSGVDPERHKIMSDEKIKFVWSRESNVIHDKSCECVKKIGIKNLRTSGAYNIHKKQCPYCKEIAYIRAGGDFAQKDKYIEFFDRINMDEDLIERLFINDAAQTSIFDNMLTVTMRGETWKIKALEDRKARVELLFNNFEIKDGGRIICDGFHRVKIGISIVEALEIMETYEWNEHRDNLVIKTKIDRVVISLRRIRGKLRKRIEIIKGFKNTIGEHAIYYVDGDNKPQERIVGIEHLSENDRVKIFCANNASYFHDCRRREELLEKCSCKVSFISIKAGADAVDFAIGMDAYNKCMTNPGQHIYLLSGDKHFTVIKQQIEAMAYKKTKIMHLNTIEQAYKRDERYRYKGIWNCWIGGKK